MPDITNDKDYGFYYEGLLTLVAYYRENKETVFSLLKKTDSPVTILNSIYFYLLQRKDIKPIREGLSLSELEKLWLESSVKETKYKRLCYCRAKYLMGII